MSALSESVVENAALEWLSALNYAVRHGREISPDGPAPERVSHAQVLLTARLREALERLNPHLPAETLEEVLRKVERTETPSLVEENRRLHRYLIEGVPVEVAREDGTVGGDVARLIDFNDPDANDWLAVNQYTVVEHGHNRRPDVVLFVNGLPLAVIELKNPGDEHATLQGAFNQLQTYKAEIPSLFRTNAALVTSDGIQARLGSLTANLERFMPWRTVDGTTVAPKGTPELETVIKGVFNKSRFLTLIRDFTVFGDTGSGLVKIVAGYHQHHAVLQAVGHTTAAASPGGDRRIGVIWHTQGSGKSLLNAITTAEVLQELIELAKDIRAARQRGGEEGLSEEEIAFYDALAQNESAVEVMGNDHLRVIAHELLSSLKGNAPVDWQHRESARARMRVLVKRILRKHGYPPDLQDAAVRTVLRQAEVLAERWAA